MNKCGRPKKTITKILDIIMGLLGGSLIMLVIFQNLATLMAVLFLWSLGEVLDAIR